MVYICKNYGLLMQKLWFIYAKTMVYLSKNYVIFMQKLWFICAKIQKSSFLTLQCPNLMNLSRVLNPPNPGFN